MKNIRRFFSLFLSLILILCSILPVSAKADCSCGALPVVYVSGFGATMLVDENGGHAFPFSVQTLFSTLFTHAKEFDGKILPVLADTCSDLMEPLRMNPDGTSYYPLRPVYETAADTSLQGFKKNDALKSVPYTGSEFLDMQCVADEIGEDHVFNFLFDWRLSSDENADALLAYIQDVCSLTGHDRVRIYSISQGCMIVAQYLYKYADRGLVERVVFDTPVLGGTSLAADIFDFQTLALDYENILLLVADILHTELELSRVASILPLDKIGNVVRMAAELVVLPPILYSPAFLEMIPQDRMDSIRKQWFSDGTYDDLWAKVDATRRGFMADIPGTLRKAEACGTKIFLKTCAGRNMLTQTDAYADGIVDVRYSCGAAVAPYGEVFPPEYKQVKDIGRNCISPDRTIDLSAGYLPERTWIVNGLFHGQVEIDPVSYALVRTLLLTDTIQDAYSNPEYPQFLQSGDPASDVCVTCRETNCLFLPQNGTRTLLLRNTSKRHILYVNGVTVDGQKTSVSPSVLLPGKSVVLTVPDGIGTFGKITVNYRQSLRLFRAQSRIFTYSVTA